MKNETSFSRLAAISAILAAASILASTIVLYIAVDFNSGFLENPASLITAGLDEGATRLFGWGSVLELFGYSLLLIPITLYLWYWLKPRNSTWVSLYTILGLIGIVLGVIETAIRANIWPSMLVAYPQAAEAQQQVLQVLFKSITDFTFEGLYATGTLLTGLWWLGIGLELRVERRVLGIVTVLMGISILGAGIGWLLHIDPLARLEMVYFIEPLWLVWLGVVILRGAEQRNPALEAAMGD